ncbi:regulator of chromosome condensation 1/beta-lactamase-inhibitor protein II [Mycena filopes]|nr:regulator of chromosome condensation 1/beta-lactamase-inhibitor protein II [Mycena filopes]
MPKEAPVRRSSRAPVSKPAPVVKVAPPKSAAKPASKAKPPSKVSKKRAASPERSPSPPAKRARSRSQAVENVDPAVPARALKKKRSATLPPLKEAYFNPLPSIPETKRPGLQVFASEWVPDFLGEFDKPKKHAWVEEQIEEGTFGPDNAGIESVAAGGMHSIFIDENGTVWTCGGIPDPDGTLTNVPHPLKSLVEEKFRAVRVATGDSICVALDNNGEIRVWGSFRANEGSLGFSESARHQFVPIPIALDLIHKPGDYEKVSSITAGANHILVLTTHGHIFTWGSGQQAQLGRKVLERHQMKGTNPQRVILDSRALRAVAIGAGIYHSFAVDEAGTVWGWGLNTMGQTGTGLDGPDDETVTMPKVVRNLSKEELGGETVVQIAGGEHHTLFLTSGGKVFACGRSNGSQLGLAKDDEAFKGDSTLCALPSRTTTTMIPVVHIAAGLHNNMAITKDGALYCWGQGTQGELGVPDVEGGSWAAESVSCGGQHTLGLFRKRQK